MNRFLKLFVPVLIVISVVVFVLFGLDSKSLDTSKTYTYQIVNSYPHDREAFTQGLFYEDGFLYEGTGRNGFSELRKVELQTGNVLQTYELSEEFFGEGITIYGDKVIQLTYLSNVWFL